MDAYAAMRDRVVESIRGRGARTVGLQYAVGLRTRAVEFARDLERDASVSVVISADPSFGACDIAPMAVDLTVHLGHAPMPHLRYRDVLFFDLPQPPPEDWAFLEKALPLLPGRRVGLLTTTQHRTWIPALSERLASKGFTAIVSPPDRRVAYAAQVLGCDYHTATAIEADVDAFLYVGSGDFHPVGVAIACKKPVVVADPTNREARTLDEVRDRILRQRHAAIERARDAKVFGILVSRKIGQDRSDLAASLRERLSERGREGHVFAMDLVSPEHLEGYRVDAWVNTACPRIAIEDVLRYKQPMLTPPELEVVLGIRTWEDYRFDEIRA
jgi:2-(3-amino-3-carboxypropyl)histidine synthase